MTERTGMIDQKPSDHLRKVMEALELAEKIINQSGLFAGTAHIEIREANVALPALIEAVEGMEWRPISSAPKGIPVLVRGGLAMQKTGGEWFSGMEEPFFQRQLQWTPTYWMPLPKPPAGKEAV